MKNVLMAGVALAAMAGMMGSANAAYAVVM